MDVTVIGMGNMGRALALRLLGDGHAVTVWNRTPGRAQEVVAAGAREVATLVQATTNTQAVALSLADDAAVLEVVTAPGGLAAQLPEQAVLVDMSTVNPDTSAAEATAVGHERMVAAPILGAPQAVTAGRALYLLGGPEPAVERLEPLFSSLSAQRRHCGSDPRSATTIKILCNYLLLTGIATLAEVVAVGQGTGLSDRILTEVLSSVPVVAPGLHNRLGDIIGGDHNGWFSARLGAKDLTLAKSLAEGVGVPLELADAALAPYQRLVAQGRGELDIAGVVEAIRPAPRGDRPAP